MGDTLSIIGAAAAIVLFNWRMYALLQRDLTGLRADVSSVKERLAAVEAKVDILIRGLHIQVQGKDTPLTHTTTAPPFGSVSELQGGAVVFRFRQIAGLIASFVAGRPTRRAGLLHHLRVEGDAEAETESVHGFTRLTAVILIILAQPFGEHPHVVVQRFDQREVVTHMVRV